MSEPCLHWKIVPNKFRVFFSGMLSCTTFENGNTVPDGLILTQQERSGRAFLRLNGFQHLSGKPHCTTRHTHALEA